jgi:molecular chaperone GrpE
VTAVPLSEMLGIKCTGHFPGPSPDSAPEVSIDLSPVFGFCVGIQSFCKDLVEVADILEKTAKCCSEGAEPEDHRRTLEKVFQGLSLLEARLKSVFTKHGLEKMTPIGDKYDPHEHELICHMPAGVGVQPGTVALVRQDGYKLHGRTIRLAQVEVAVESQRRL